jgi:hypothetical protein
MSCQVRFLLRHHSDDLARSTFDRIVDQVQLWEGNEELN